MQNTHLLPLIEAISKTPVGLLCTCPVIVSRDAYTYVGLLCGARAGGGICFFASPAFV